MAEVHKGEGLRAYPETLTPALSQKEREGNRIGSKRKSKIKRKTSPS
jgi:hypothetical protein